MFTSTMNLKSFVIQLRNIFKREEKPNIFAVSLCLSLFHFIATFIIFTEKTSRQGALAQQPLFEQLTVADCSVQQYKENCFNYFNENTQTDYMFSVPTTDGLMFQAWCSNIISFSVLTLLGWRDSYMLRSTSCSCRRL